MKKITKTERLAREAVKHICRGAKFLGMIYIGSPRKGRFYLPRSRNEIAKAVIEYFGDDVTPEIITRVISNLINISKLESLTEDFSACSSRRRKIFDDLEEDEAS